jgi:hypothetical protein
MYRYVAGTYRRKGKEESCDDAGGGGHFIRFLMHLPLGAITAQ